MKVFQQITSMEHEQVSFFYDAKTGARVIIGIHDTTLGPALGGARLWTYENEEDALRDVLRLSRGMTYKAAVANLELGGGKSVLLRDENTRINENYFRSFGRFVESLKGKYITAEDVGTNVRYMEWVKQETEHVVGLPLENGGSGDPSVMTAYGVYQGMKASCKTVYGSDDLSGRKVSIQGCGHVACYLIEYIMDEGAEVVVCDINPEKIKEVRSRFGVNVVDPGEIYDVDAHIFSPSALGGILNDNTIPRLRVDIIAGAANNQLDDENDHMQQIIERDILYAPDYVINAGGLINVYHELKGPYSKDSAFSKTREIYNTLIKIYDIASAQNIPTNEASYRLARERIDGVKKGSVSA